ncbi:hypothetical protein IPC1347_29755 [Pseudomonas aeruginosa]|uniref:hypothetical protein n=1 Tax=Pseudomonas aeruginosa TaxID=287 RepID=UPI001067AA51|nr:hypothetical protein [Pseudomonas aeruginosa]MBM2721249.1 hypothetical protein [Pseudomonas aeruginosa]MDG3590965.1 hypothetical protein [Pseudomonas aeruginosa]MDG4039201.1 hypothetical protein [Pseudomonas aeruginosa]MDG4113683.1 hypothetical protein [Pseudomonas aeruginosa]MDU0641542.1 hypothetical protein [Pseudomonas aeruginosa]
MVAFSEVRKDYNGVRKIWGKYWDGYGGFRALFSSFYFYLALFLTLINYGAWSEPGWWDTVISSIPTILGFTLAGFAVFLGMDSGFSRFMAKRSKVSVSPFMSLVSAFVHFIVMQAIALIFALTLKSLHFSIAGLPQWYYQAVYWGNRFFWFLAYLAFMYSVVLVFSATFAIFRASRWYEAFVQTSDDSSGV